MRWCTRSVLILCVVVGAMSSGAVVPSPSGTAVDSMAEQLPELKITATDITIPARVRKKFARPDNARRAQAKRGTEVFTVKTGPG